MNTPTRFPGGLSTSGKHTPFGMFGGPFPGKYHVYFNDFDSLSEFNGITDTPTWDVSATGTGTLALGDGDGGLALLTNSAAAPDALFFQKKGESFRFAPNKQVWFGIRFSVSNALQSAFAVGLMISDSTPLDVTDGVFFLKNTAVATPALRVEKAESATTQGFPEPLVDNQMVELAFYYDGRSAVYGYANGVRKATLVTTNLPTTEDLTVSFGMSNGVVGAGVMAVDWVFAAKER